MGGPAKVFKKLVKTAEEKNIIKKVEQPKVAAQMDNTEVKSDLITADKTAPTSIEMENENLLKRKRGRKTKTVLTSITGDKSKPTLSKKALLG